MVVLSVAMVQPITIGKNDFSAITSTVRSSAELISISALHQSLPVRIINPALIETRPPVGLITEIDIPEARRRKHVHA